MRIIPWSISARYRTSFVSLDRLVWYMDRERGKKVINLDDKFIMWKIQRKGNILPRNIANLHGLIDHPETPARG